MFRMSVIIPKEKAILLKRLVQLSIEIIAEVLFLDRTIMLWYAAKALCALPILSHKILKRHALEYQYFLNY